MGMRSDCLDDVQELLDGTRRQLRALRSESEPHNGVVPTSVNEDVLDCDVSCLALNFIFKDGLARHC